MLRHALVAALVLLAAPRPADACGGYIAPQVDRVMLNDALELVVVRDGTRTEVSVRNRYRGEVADFAILIPVPQVLHEEDVHTLSSTVFDALAGITAPTLEYLEELDPCPRNTKGASGDDGSGAPGGGRGSDAVVRVEAAFQVAEYDIEVLSATDATALDAWLKDHQYAVSATMAPLLRPYVESNAKFFVAKVDPKRVTFVDGVATLSPLRFGYDADEVSLPLRLSTANSPGSQDIVVHTIAAHTLEAANRPNTTIPTGFGIHLDHGNFAEFYEALFAATLAKQPGAVVTEYAWQAQLDPAVAAAIGATAISSPRITRLHLRIDRDGPHDDLVLRETATDLSHQAHYTTVQPWRGKADCDHPAWGQYRSAGMGSGGGFVSVQAGPPPSPGDLAGFLDADLPTLGVEATHPAARPERRRRGASGGCCDTGGAPGGAVALVLLVALALPSRRARPAAGDDRARRV